MKELIKNNLSLIGSATGIAGALLIALNIGMFFLGYILFLTSSIAWVTYAAQTKQKNLLTMNVVFGLINLVGVINFA